MEELQAKGYQMGIFASSKLNSPAFNKNIFSQVENLRIESKGTTKVERDRDMQKDFLHFLKNRDKNAPFFGFLFYDAAHGQEFPWMSWNKVYFAVGQCNIYIFKYPHFSVIGKIYIF